MNKKRTKALPLFLSLLGLAGMSGILKASNPYEVPVQDRRIFGHKRDSMFVDLSGFTRKASPDVINPLYNTEWELCIPGMANPFQRAQFLAAMIDRYSNPQLADQHSFEQFTHQLSQRVKDDLIDLARDLTVPGVMQRASPSIFIEKDGQRRLEYRDVHSGSIRDCIITEITNDYNRTAMGYPAINVYHGDKILRLKEIQKILNCYPTEQGNQLSTITLSGALKIVGTVAAIAAIWIYFEKQSKQKKTAARKTSSS